MAVAGWNGKLFAHGATTVFAAEPCTQIGVTKSFQINTSAKRLLDTTANITVKIGGAAQAAAAIVSIDPQFGIVTFVNAPGGAVTIDGSYLALQPVANLRELNISPKAAVLDVSVMGVHYKQKALGQDSDSGDFTGLDPLVTVVDGAAGAGNKSFWDWFTGKKPKLVQYDFDGANTYVYRNWVVFPGVSQKSQLAAVMNSQTMWEASAPQQFPNLAVPILGGSFGAP